MLDPTPNIDPKEATEAKLCAYLEGELSPSERTEIEQHLAANPQHRQLLADLAKTREWMRSIPAETSPFDLAEAFAAQTERSMLLDDSQTSSRLVLHWQQYLSLAAIVALTIGLGVLVAYMLRAPKAGDNKSFSLGPAVPFTSPPTQPEGMDKITDQQPTKPSATAAQAPLAIASAADETRRAMAKALPTEVDATRPGVMAARVDNSDVAAVDSVKTKLQDAGYRLPIGQKTICFMVSADAPAAAMDQVRGFFNRHQLAFDDVITGQHEPAANGFLATGGAGFGNQPATPPSTQPIAAAVNQNQSIATGAANNTDSRRLQNGQNDLTQGSTQNPADGFPPSQINIRPGNAFITPTTAPTDHAIYVADGLTQLQLELLSASLESENLKQSVRRITLSEGIVPPPASQPFGAVKVGQTLTITVAELVAPGVEKTNVVKVADDGSIALPMIDPLPAAGLLPADLQRRIADKYKEANLIPQATVTFAMPASSTTQAIASTTQAVTQPAVAATQPIAPSVASHLTNVVVVIEKSASVLPGK